MSTDLETILSGQGASAPAPEPRNEPQPEQPAEPQANADPASESEPQPDERGNVPVAALTAEREKGRKKYTEAVADFDKRLAEADQRWQQRFDQLVGNLTRPQPATPEPAADPIQPFDALLNDPNAFVRGQAAEIISPVMSQLKAMQRGMAELQFKPEVVAEAEKAFNAAAEAGQLPKEFIQQVNASPNPWAAAVEWHRHTQTMSEIGSDPAAYKAKLAEEIRAQVMAELQQGQQQPDAQRPAPAMPGNFATGRNVGSRAGPAWSGPSPLDDILGQRR